MSKSYTYYIGIDPGVNTGFALWVKPCKGFDRLYTKSIHDAMKDVEYIIKHHDAFVRIEDARKRKWFGERSQMKQQGAGSVKRDCSIWEDFLTDLGADFEMVAPVKGMTKYNEAAFKKLTGYHGNTSTHSRDAAMLVFGI